MPSELRLAAVLPAAVEAKASTYGKLPSDVGDTRVACESQCPIRGHSQKQWRQVRQLQNLRDWECAGSAQASNTAAVASKVFRCVIVDSYLLIALAGVGVFG